MLGDKRSFVSEYDARFVDSPPAGEVDYTFTDGSGSARAETVSVVPWSAPSWTGSFTATDPLVRRALSGLFGTPSPVKLCVVQRGSAFLVDVLSPTDYLPALDR
jgi:hypothetical protein